MRAIIYRRKILFLVFTVFNGRFEFRIPNLNFKNRECVGIDYLEGNNASGDFGDSLAYIVKAVLSVLTVYEASHVSLVFDRYHTK